MEFQYKNRGFDFKNNFEIKPSLGMGISTTSMRSHIPFGITLCHHGDFCTACYGEHTKNSTFGGMVYITPTTEVAKIVVSLVRGFTTLTTTYLPDT